MEYHEYTNLITTKCKVRILITTIFI